jgi:DNA-binding transcriptional MerR regulator
MGTDLTIQQVSALTHLSEHTLRYYERIGLLDPIHRASSGHRRYSTQDIAWIEFLTRLRTTGMSISKMQQFAALRRQGDHTVPERRLLLEVHRDEVQAKLDELQHNLSEIQQKIQLYKTLEQNNDVNT